jgi:DNA-binding MarR family transcriptional regulator
MDEALRGAALADLRSLPGHLLWRASARVGVGLARILPEGTDIHAYAVLLALAEHEPQSQRAVADLIGVSGTTVTTVTQRLQEDGLVERVRKPADRRSWSLTRTPAGRVALRRWARHVVQLEEHLTAHLTAAQANRLREVLLRGLGDQLHDQTPAALLSSTAFLVTRAHQTSHRRFASALRPLGIEPRHFGTMRALAVTGPVSQHDLAGLLDVSPATVVHIVDELEHRGLLTRGPDPADRRVHRISLTEAATPVLREASTRSWASLEPCLGGPESHHTHDLVALLRLLLTPSAA